MTSPRKPSLMLPIVVTLAVLLGLYVGAYYGTVRPVSARLIGGDMIPVYSTTGGKMLFSGQWPPRTTGWNRFFAPMHWLDRRIRPHVWESVP